MYPLLLYICIEAQSPHPTHALVDPTLLELKSFWEIDFNCHKCTGWQIDYILIKWIPREDEPGRGDIKCGICKALKAWTRNDLHMSGLKCRDFHLIGALCAKCTMAACVSPGIRWHILKAMESLNAGANVHCKGRTTKWILHVHLFSDTAMLYHLHALPGWCPGLSVTSQIKFAWSVVEKPPCDKSVLTQHLSTTDPFLIALSCQPQFHPPSTHRPPSPFGQLVRVGTRSERASGSWAYRVKGKNSWQLYPTPNYPFIPLKGDIEASTVEVA